jgi:tetratricopeptide (TPR) repeat protein
MKFATVCLVVLTIVTAGCAGSSQNSGSQTTRGKDGSPDPMYSLTLMRQGSILLQQQQFNEALERFVEADRVAPGNTTVHNMIGLCHLKLGAFDQALTSFNRSLDLAPSFTDARNNRGVTYLRLNQLRLAEVDFLAVLGDSTYPHRWEVHYNLGITYMERDQLGAAEENFRKAIMSPQPVFDAYMRLADIVIQQGQPEQAIEHLEDARLRYPEHTAATLRLGRLLVELGRPEEARPFLQEVIDKQPGSNRAKEAAELLDSL